VEDGELNQRQPLVTINRRRGGGEDFFVFSGK
jgi:hypothetical protein